MSILLLLLACKPGSSFDLEGIWRLEVQASTTASGACDVRLLDNVVGAIEDTGGTDTGTDGWTETTEQTTSPATSLVRFARDGDGYVLITGGELLPQEAGGDASSPSFAWTRTETSRDERTHTSGYSYVAEEDLSAVTRVQVTLPNEQEQKDAQRSDTTPTLTGTWAEETDATQSWEEADLWPEELGIGDTGAIPLGSYVTRLDALGYVQPATNGRADSDCTDDTCVLTVSSTCSQAWDLTATRTDLDPGDPGWQDLQWAAGI